MTGPPRFARLAACIVALAAAGCLLVALASRLNGPQSEPAQARGVLLVSGDLEWPRGYDALAYAPSVDSVDVLESALTDGVRLVVLGPGVSSGLRTDGLSPIADRGIAIMAIETPLPELWRVSGALTVLRRTNPGFAADEVRRVSCRDCTGFYSYAWHSCPADPSQQGGSGQGDLAHAPRFADRLRGVLALARTCPDATY
jgi:hypothetical protein